MRCRPQSPAGFARWLLGLSAIVMPQNNRMVLARLNFLLTVGVFCLSCAEAADAPPKPGAWEFQITTTALADRDSKPISLGEQRMMACLTEGYFQRPPFNTEGFVRKGWKCAQPSSSSASGMEEWVVHCKGPDQKALTVLAKVRKSAERMTTETISTTIDPDGRTTVTMSGTATFRGECKDGMPRF